MPALLNCTDTSISASCCTLHQVRNHEAVAKFALRGAGRPGPRPVSAPLSDPTARPALEHMDAMDAALRHVVHAMLVGVEAKQLSPQALQVGGVGCM